MRAVIIGYRGQDGRWLSEILSARGYEVFGIHKPSHVGIEIEKTLLIEKEQKLTEEYCVDFSDYSTAFKYLDLIRPSRIFHLGAIHGASIETKNNNDFQLREMKKCHVQVTSNLLQWISKNKKLARLAVALSSQMYSVKSGISVINEYSKLSPQNIYGQTKLESFQLIKEYREYSDVFTSGSILFNHTSIYAKPNFLFKVLATQINEFRHNIRQRISLFNADFKIDMCHAREACEAMYLSLEADIPKDYVISSGNLMPIRSIVKDAAKILNIGIKDIDIESSSSEPQTNTLVGDSKQIAIDLGWRATTKPSELLANMVEYESGMQL